MVKSPCLRFIWSFSWISFFNKLKVSCYNQVKIIQGIFFFHNLNTVRCESSPHPPHTTTASAHIIRNSCSFWLKWVPPLTSEWGEGGNALFYLKCRCSRASKPALQNFSNKGLEEDDFSRWWTRCLQLQKNWLPELDWLTNWPWIRWLIDFLLDSEAATHLPQVWTYSRRCGWL